MVKEYDPKDCVVLVDGNTLTGLSEDMVTGEKDEDNFETAVGAQGDVVVNVSRNELGTVTVTLQATSPFNSVLKNMAATRAVCSIWVNHTGLNERFGGNKAMVKKTPSVELGTEAGDREYEFQVFDYTSE